MQVFNLKTILNLYVQALLDMGPVFLPLESPPGDSRKIDEFDSVIRCPD
jgi:hypothetical protein